MLGGDDTVETQPVIAVLMKYFCISFLMALLSVCLAAQEIH